MEDDDFITEDNTRRDDKLGNGSKSCLWKHRFQIYTVNILLYVHGIHNRS